MPAGPGASLVADDGGEALFLDVDDLDGFRAGMAPPAAGIGDFGMGCSLQIIVTRIR